MKSKMSLLLLISLCLLAFSSRVFGYKYLVVAPGQTWTAGATGNGISGVLASQVAGVPFNVSVVAIDESFATATAFNAASFPVTMTCNATSLITPANPFPLNQLLGSTPNALKYPVTVTLGNAISGNVVIAANPNAGGPSFGSVTITSQIITQYVFSPIPNQTAGQGFYISVSAQASVAVVTGFNGTAQITANYPVIGPVPVGTVQFTNGNFYGFITLTAATQANMTLTCASTTPAATGNSNTFNVVPGALSGLVIIGPGQTFAPGSGNGRLGNSTSTSQSQTAGSYFYVTVYAVDAFFNTSTTSTVIALSSSDPNCVITPANPGGVTTTAGPDFGRAIFTVQIRTVGSGTQILTATAPSITASQDTVPMTFGALDHFNFSQPITDKTAGELFTVNAAAVDLYNNTVTTFASTPAVSFYSNTGTFLLDSYHTYNHITPFLNGLGSFLARIYKVSLNATIKLTYLTTSGTSNPTFNVAPSDFSKLLFVADGQTWDPGSIVNVGVSGNPNQAIAGTSFTMSVYSTDFWGNQISSVSDNVSITATDSVASITGVTLPANVSLSSGSATYNIIFRTGGAITVNGTDTTTTGITDASSIINVLATGLSDFAVANVPSSTVAGQAFTTFIKARDQYGNVKTDFTGAVYLSANTDYALPYESTMQVTGPPLTTGAYYQTWKVTFTAGDQGVRQLTGYLYRAATYTAQIFASDNFIDTPISHSGHFGLSGNCTVNAGTAVKLQVLPPGMEARPGTPDGENNTPTGQSISSDFSCTAALVDTWWNIVKGSIHQISVTTSDFINSSINDVSIASAPAQLFISSTTGTVTFNASYASQSSAFSIIVSDVSVGGITPDTSPNIFIFTLQGIAIQAPGGADFAAQTAGVPFWVSITAYANVGQVATGFNGTMKISASTDYDASNFTITPTNSVTFTAGIAVMQVTMWRAWTNYADHSGAYIIATFGSNVLPAHSNNFDVFWGPLTNVLVLADGMTHKPGLKQDGIPGYKGYAGTPTTVEAGFGKMLDVLYLDDNYNIVYFSPTTYTAYTTYAKLTSTDPLASVDGNNLAANNIYVTITAGTGKFHTDSGMVLRTVGSTGQQSITAETGGAAGNNTTPPINMRHTTFDHFGVSAPGGPVIAGVPFNITLQALDQFQNICDDLNGGTPYNSSAALQAKTSANTANTMLPVSYLLSKGEAIASVQLFQAPDTNIHINAGSGSNLGASAAIITAPNEFKRLLVMTAGMIRTNGVYSTGLTSTVFTMYDTTLPPFSPSNQVIVNDAGHTPSGYPFTIYSCDAYGNITATADVLGQTITVTTNDPYALPVTLTSIDSGTGLVGINMVFHRAAPGIFVSASITNPLIQSFTTPSFTTLAGTPYGLQVVVPGLTADNGSGHLSGPGWYNGMTGTPQTQLSGGQPFTITIQASDIYGNFTNSVTDQVNLISNSSTSFPGDDTLNPSFIGTLGQPADAGISTLSAQMVVASAMNVQLNPYDITDPTKNHILKPYPIIYVALSGSLQYSVLADPNTYTANTDAAYTDFGDSSNSINALAKPAKFAFRVNVIDSFSKQPVYGETNNFMCTPVAYPDWNIVLGGTLGIAQGTSVNGKYQTINQSYTGATSFRIRVSDLSSSGLLAAYSPIIVMGANPNSVTLTVGVRNSSGFHTGIYNVQAATDTVITGHLTDGNGNNLNGPPVSFSVITGSGTFTGNTKNATAATVNGDATVDFFGAFTNENNLIRASYNGYYAYITMAVSIVDPVLGQVSNYPNPFRAGSENTNISYLLDANSDVKIRIYTLFGDLVFSRDIPSGKPCAAGGAVNNYVWDGKNNKGAVIGNGGYICVVEATISGARKKMIRKIAVAK